MRFPSLIRLPRNKKFEFTARHYDPIKEEIEERTARIKREMRGEDPGHASPRITFDRKLKAVQTSSMMQLFIAALLGLTVVGWLYYGNDVFYTLWLVVPVYLFFRLRKSNSRK